MNAEKKIYQILAALAFLLTTVFDLWSASRTMPLMDDFMATKAILSLLVKSAFVIFLFIGNRNTGFFLVACANLVIPFLNFLGGNFISAVMPFLATFSLAICAAFACLPSLFEKRSTAKSLQFLPVIFYAINIVVTRTQDDTAPMLVTVIVFLIMYGFPYLFTGLWLGSAGAVEKAYSERTEISVSRQNAVETASNGSLPDQIRQYKQLLEDGLITQEDFEAKKKQLLEL